MNHFPEVMQVTAEQAAAAQAAMLRAVRESLGPDCEPGHIIAIAAGLIADTIAVCAPLASQTPIRVGVRFLIIRHIKRWLTDAGVIAAFPEQPD